MDRFATPAYSTQPRSAPGAACGSSVDGQRILGKMANPQDLQVLSEREEQETRDKLWMRIKDCVLGIHLPDWLTNPAGA